MAEDDSLISLKVDDSSLIEQFQKIEKAMQSLGANSFQGLNSSLKGLGDQLNASSEVLSKLATSSQSSAKAVSQSETQKQASFDKTTQNLIKYSSKIVSELEKTISAENRAASAVEAAEMKKQQALLKASQLWEREVSKQQAVGDKLASEEAKNALIVIGALQQQEAARMKAAEAAEQAAKGEVVAAQRAITAEKMRQESLVASLLMYERLSSAAATPQAPLRRAGLNEYQNAWNYQRNESPLYSSMFDDAQKRDNESFNKQQQNLQQQMSAREKFQYEKDHGQGNAPASEQVSMYSNMFDEIHEKEQSSLRQSLADRESSVRSLKSQVESLGGMKNFGPENGLNKQEQKDILDLIEAQGMQLRARPSALEKELGYMGRMLVSWIALGAVFETASAATHEIEKSIKEASEFQVQGVMFGAYQKSRTNAGQSTDGTNQTQILSESIKLATAYGDSVNDVAQDLNLWYKRTGDLGSATYMTAQALEFQTATGTQLEDTYRTLTALGAQLSGQKMGLGDSTTFNLSRTHELLEMITAASVAAGAGLHNLGPANQNSADTLAKAIEKDGAAMKSFGFTTLETVSINQAAIQSFGNTGQAAEEAAEKIGRIMGGLASLSDPAKNKKLLAAGIDVSKLDSSRSFGDQRNVLEQIAQTYDKLDAAHQHYLATQLTGARQYEQLIAILDTMHHAEQLAIETKKNMSLEDDLATQMQGTQQQSLKRLEGAWEGLEITVGNVVLPGITSAVQAFTANVIPMLDGLINHFSMLSGAAAGAMAGAAFGSFIPGVGTAAGAAAGAIGGGLFGASTDNDRLLAGRYGSDYLKYKDEISRSGAGALGGGGQGNLSKGAQDFQARMSRVDSKLGTFNSLIGKKAKDPSAYLSAADEYAQQNHLTQIPEVQHAEGQEVAKNSSAFIKMYMANASKKNAEVLKNINDQNQAKEGPLSIAGDAGKGQLKDYQIAGEAVSDLRNRYQELNETIAENKQNIDRAISSDEKRIQIFGVTAQTLKPLNDDLYKKGRENASAISGLSPFESQFESVAASDKSKANKAGMGTQEGKGFFQEYLAAAGEARRIREEINGIKEETQGLIDKALQYKETLAKTNMDSLLKSQSTKFNQLDKKFNDAKSAGSKSVLSGQMENYASSAQAEALSKLASTWPKALQGSTAYASAQQTIIDHYTDMKEKADAAEASSDKFNQSLSDKFSKGMFSEQAKGLDSLISFGKTSANSKQSQDMEDQIKLIRELQDETIKYNQDLSDAAGNTDLTKQAESLHSLTDEVIYAGAAVDQFKEKLDALHSTDWYKAVEAGFSEIGKMLEKSIMDSAFGNDHYNATIQGIDATITALDQQKQIEDEMFSLTREHSAMQDANHKLALVQIQQQITAENQLKQAQKDRMDHPGFIKSTLESISSNYIQNYTKQVEGSLLGGIGGGNDAQSQTNKALKDYVDATKNSLPGTIKDFGSYVKDFMASVHELKSPSGSTGTNPGQEALANAFNPMGGTSGSLFVTPDASSPTSTQAGPTLAAAGALGLNLTNSEKSGQNTGGGSTTENAAKGGMGALGSIASTGTALGLSMAKTPVGSALTIAGGSMTGGASSAKGGAGAYLSTAGNVVNAFGTSEDSGIGSIIGGGAGMALGGPAGMAIGSSLGGIIGSIFGPKQSISGTPDQMANSGYNTYLANATGQSTTSANGLTYEDPTLQAGLGNQSELGYIDQFVKAHPGGAGLTGASLQMWQQANTLTAGGTGTQIGYGGQAGGINKGNQGIETASGQQIGGYQNWQDLANTVQNVTQQLVTFNGGLNAANSSLVVLNQFGSGQGVTPGAWDTPGIAENPANYTTPGSALATSVTGNGVTPQAQAINAAAAQLTSAVGPTSTVNTASGNSQPIVLNTTTTLDGKILTQSVQSYQIRSQQAGYSRVT